MVAVEYSTYRIPILRLIPFSEGVKRRRGYGRAADEMFHRLILPSLLPKAIREDVALTTWIDSL